MKNDKQELIERLNNQTNKTLAEIETRRASGNYPAFLLDEMRESVMILHNAYLSKIAE
jgi:hypothetical protein